MSLADLLKVDLAFSGGDLDNAAGGDYRTLSLEANVKQAVFHRLITVPGTLMHRPEYGVGLSQFLNEPLSINKKRELARRIKQNLERDPRVEEVTRVSIDDADNGGGRVDVTVEYRILGYGTVTNEFEGIGV